MPDPKHIVLIHGVADISKQWRRAKPFFESHGFVIHFYNYRTLENELDIPLIVGGLAEFILENIGSAGYQIFAHSQGGLIAEWYDLFKGDENLKRIVTIGTPFQGNTLPIRTPQSIVKRLPIGRKQIEGLACMSSILSALIHARLEIRQTQTQYISLVGHSVEIFNIQSDGVVSVCAGNRDADYFFVESDKIHSLPLTESTRLIYVKTNHLPLSIVRLLQTNRLPNPFSTLLLSTFNDEAVFAYNTFMPTQCAIVIPSQLKDDLQFNDGIKKLISHPTPDKKYLIVYCTLRSLDAHIAIAGQSIPLQPGKFTYLLDSAFLNTRT